MSFVHTIMSSKVEFTAYYYLPVHYNSLTMFTERTVSAPPKNAKWATVKTSLTYDLHITKITRVICTSHAIKDFDVKNQGPQIALLPFPFLSLPTTWLLHTSDENFTRNFPDFSDTIVSLLWELEEPIRGCPWCFCCWDSQSKKLSEQLDEQ